MTLDEIIKLIIESKEELTKTDLEKIESLKTFQRIFMKLLLKI